jgi:hypothetical protein
MADKKVRFGFRNLRHSLASFLGLADGFEDCTEFAAAG